MTRNDVFTHIANTYQTAPEFPWKRTPHYAVFRHKKGRKWFAAIVDVQKEKLGLLGQEVVDALLLKCDPHMIGALLNGRNILPGYHMNKEHWITVVLDGSAPFEQVATLIALSHSLTQA